MAAEGCRGEQTRHGKAPSETITKAETNIENTELNSHNRINFGDSLQDKRIYFKFGMLIFGYVIAKCLYATGRRPFALPHRRNYVPAKLTCPRHVNTYLQRFAFFFSRGQLIHSLRHAFSVPPPSVREALMHVSPRIYCRGRAD